MPLVNPAFRAVGSISPARFVSPAGNADFSVASSGIVTTGTTATSTSITAIPVPNGICNGSQVVGSGVPAGTYVVSGGGTASIVISAATSSSLTGTALTFYGKPIGIAQDGSKFPQTADGWGSGASTVAAEDGDQLLVYGLGEVCLLEVDSSGGASSAAPPIVAGDWLVTNSVGQGVKFTNNSGNGAADNLPTHIGAIALEAPTSASSSSLIRVQVVNFSFTQ